MATADDFMSSANRRIVIESTGDAHRPDLTDGTRDHHHSFALPPEVSQMVAAHEIELDGAVIELRPHYWLVSGTIPYDGHVIAATFQSVDPPQVDVG